MSKPKAEGTTRAISGWCLPGANQHAGSDHENGVCRGVFPSFECSCKCHEVDTKA